MRPRLFAALAAALLGALTACGSTVQQQATLEGAGSESAALGGSLGGGNGTGASASGSSQTAPLSRGASVATGQRPLSGRPTGGAASGVSGGQSAPGGPQEPSGRGPAGTAAGMTATTIKIGVYTAQGYSSFASKFGANIATGDNRAQANAVIKYLNEHGGLAGRKIVPVFHDFDIAAASTNLASEYQSACAAWTQDERVYAMVTPIGTVDNSLYDCLSKAGVVTVSAGDSKDASFFGQYGDWFYEPTDMNLRRILSNNVDGLAAAGFFGAHPKIGVVLTDTPNDQAAVNRGLKPALARHGLVLADTFAAPIDSSAQAAYSNAVLRFKADGITHILFTSAASPIQFMADASSQQYYPRYGLQSKNSPSTLQGVSSARAQRGAMGIGWQPMNDVDGAHDPGTISARQALCLKLLKDAGQDTSTRATSVLGLWYCDNLFFLHDAMLHASSFDVRGLRQGAESLTSFEAASTFRSTFAPSRLHDGASAYRLFAFKDDCSCYQYVSPLRRAS